MIRIEFEMWREWTPVKEVPFDSELIKWCQIQNSQGKFFYHPTNGGWFFELEQDALLFKLMWGSFKKQKVLLVGDHFFGINSIPCSPDVNAPKIKVMKSRTVNYKAFRQQYECVFDPLFREPAIK